MDEHIPAVQVTPLPYKGYAPTIVKTIAALDNTRPEHLTLRTCPRCNANTPVFNRVDLYDCSECANRGVELDLSQGGGS